MEQFSAHEGEELNEDPLHYEDPVMHISGAGHWFLEGWIGDHAVDFLVDSGSSVTAMSDIFYKNLVHAGAPVGALQITARTLRSANGTGIEVLGCSSCSVSFLGLRTEFPIVVCSLAAGTDAIIGTDVLGSVLPHTLDIKKGLLFAQGGVSLQLHRRDSALSGRVFTVGHSSIPPYSEAVLHCSVRTTGRALSSIGRIDPVRGRNRPHCGKNFGRPLRVEGSCLGVEFQPRDRRGEPLYGGGNDRPGDRHTVSD